MELKEVIQQMIQQTQKAMQPTEMQIGTVASVNPLEIKLDTNMATLNESVLYLTEPVVEKKIPVLQHSHSYDGGTTAPALLESEIICGENSSNLPVSGGYITLNEGLAVGQKVLLMRVQNGQKFVIISRVFDFGGGG